MVLKRWLPTIGLIVLCLGFIVNWWMQPVRSVEPVSAFCYRGCYMPGIPHCTPAPKPYVCTPAQTEAGECLPLTEPLHVPEKVEPKP